MPDSTMTAVWVHCPSDFMPETVLYAGESLWPGREGKMEQFDQWDREIAGLRERRPNLVQGVWISRGDGTVDSRPRLRGGDVPSRE